MAYIGLRMAVFAPISSHTEGSAITYGTGKVIGMMIGANVAVTRNNQKLYADDVVAEEDNSISSASITVNVDDLTLENEKFVLGLSETTSGTGTTTTTYHDTDDASPLGGFGYIRVRSKTNQSTGVTSKTYIASWWHKVRARMEAEEATTKGENMAWATPSIIFNAQGAYIDSSDKLKFRQRQEFASYSAAEAYLKGLANITTVSGGGSGGGESS